MTRFSDINKKIFGQSMKGNNNNIKRTERQKKKIECLNDSITIHDIEEIQFY